MTRLLKTTKLVLPELGLPVQLVKLDQLELYIRTYKIFQNNFTCFSNNDLIITLRQRNLSW